MRRDRRGFERQSPQMAGFDLPQFLIGYVVFLFSTTLHEFGHAKMAHKLGSSFAADQGLATLNPLVHIKRSPFGMVGMPILGVLLMGWMWPIGWASVPYDAHWASRNPRRMAWMTLCGPLSNFLLAGLAIVACKLLLSAGVLVVPEQARLDLFLLPADGNAVSPVGAAAYALSTLLFMNVTLGIFNMLPVPPLDGSGVLEGFFPRQVGPLFDKVREQPVIGLVLFLLVFNFAWRLIQPVLIAVARFVM